MSDTTKDAVPLTDEQIAALKAAALAATPQNIDSAQRIERYEDGSHIECPACSGEGHVELEADFCNYDGAAIGVQFYGIGNAHGAAEAYLRAAMPATILALIDRLERAQVQAEAEPVAEVIKWRTLTGHTAWDFKVFDKTLEHGAKLYTAPQPSPTAVNVALSMTNGDFHCPACGNVMKGPTSCGSCLWEAETCGYKTALVLDERAAFPRYTEWLHLREHGQWSNGVPDWARDHFGHMNDFTAASAVIEELACAARPASGETE